MATTAESPFKIVRSTVQKFLNEMRILRATTQEQVKARAEEIKSNSLAPGKSQYSVSEVDGIVRIFKQSYVQLLGDVHLMIVTDGTTKIRHGIEQGYVNSGFITEEMMDQLTRAQTEAEKVPTLEKELSQLRIQAEKMSVENTDLKSELTEAQTYISTTDERIGELSKRVSTADIDDSIIRERDDIIQERDKIIHKLSLEKTNLQSEFNHTKIERDAFAKRVEEMEARLRSVQTESDSKEDHLFEEIQKQLEKSRATVFNLRNQLAEKDDTVRNQKIDISQKSNQIEAVRIDLEHAQTQANELLDKTNQQKNELQLLQKKMEEQESTSSIATELSELENTLRQEIEQKDKLLIEQTSKLESTSQQLEEIRKQDHQKDTDMERLAETMMELQQDISGKEREIHQSQTQIDEFMLQIAEKEAEIKELDDKSARDSSDVEKAKELLSEKEALITSINSEFEEVKQELVATKQTLDTIEKQGTMSSEEKYHYELQTQKLKRRIDLLVKTMKSLEGFLNTDPKYRILYLLNDFKRPLTIDEMTRILNLRKEVVAKYVFELDYFSYIKKNIDDKTTTIESTALLTPPLSYEEEKEE